MADILNAIEQELSKATYALLAAKEQLKVLRAAIDSMSDRRVVHVKNSDES